MTILLTYLSKITYLSKTTEQPKKENQPTQVCRLKALPALALVLNYHGLF